MKKYGLYDPDREQVVSTKEHLMTEGNIEDLFTIVDGPIMCLSLFGHITESMSANNCTMGLTADPVVGASLAMCVGLNVISDVVGGFWFISGFVGDALINHIPGNDFPRGMARPDGQSLFPIIYPEGGIDLTLSNTNPTTGKAIWYIRYKPTCPGAYVIGS